MATYEPQFRDWATTASKELNGLRNIVCNTSNPYHHASTLKKAVKVETAKGLRKKLKEAEKRERDFRKAQKRVKAEGRATDRRRQVALDALERLARDGFDVASVEAAKTLLEHSSF